MAQRKTDCQGLRQSQMGCQVITIEEQSLRIQHLSMYRNCDENNLTMLLLILVVGGFGQAKQGKMTLNSHLE